MFIYIIVKRQERRWLTEISAAYQHWFQYDSVSDDLPCVQFERRHSGKGRLKTRIVRLSISIEAPSLTLSEDALECRADYDR